VDLAKRKSQIWKNIKFTKTELKQKNRANSIPYCTSNSCKLSRMPSQTYSIPGSFGCAWNFFILAFCKKEKSMTNSEFID
jgi:hypothetical protein